ncbi:hypothetical protein E2C01_060271 [Portunus trituberculatus]|uniref:Uncharacterized protein n=1 Tax=Portunus trituberculatus TaxID=210409 RepID=A0A5B7HA04_PORTR|nr:hypothetical protein [Portunus trituberculatus]
MRSTPQTPEAASTVSFAWVVGGRYLMTRLHSPSLFNCLQRAVTLIPVSFFSSAQSCMGRGQVVAEST